MLVHPPAEGLFRRECWSLEGNIWLSVRRGIHFMRLLVVDADTHDIEVHHRAQLSCENAEEFLRGANGDEGLRNAQKRFVPLTSRGFSRSLTRSAHHSPAANISSIRGPGAASYLKLGSEPRRTVRL